MVERSESVEETRQRVIRTSRVLFRERWYDDVTLGQIAAAASVSHQTVLNHFKSKEGVFGAVLASVEAEVIAFDKVAADADAATAVRMLVERYEQTGLENVRFVLQEHRSQALRETLERARAHHRVWLEETFAHRLPPAGRERRRTLAALVLATEVMAWHAVRHEYGFSKADTAAAITDVVERIVEGRT